MKDSSKSEAELADEVDTLEHVLPIIQGEMSKNPAVLQKKIDTRTINNVISALNAVIEDDSELQLRTTRLWKRRRLDRVQYILGSRKSRS